MPGKIKMIAAVDRGSGGGDNVRRMRATEKQSHSRQILAPTFQLLGNLQICSQLRRGKKCYRVGERRLQDRSAGLAGEQTCCRDLGFLPKRQLVNSLGVCTDFESVFALYLHLYFYLYLYL